MAEIINWASFVTGGGTTMDCMAQAIETGEVKGIKPAVVIGSKECGGLEKAAKRNIPIIIVNPRDFRGADNVVDEYAFGNALNAELKKYGVDLITQNGWLPKTPRNVIDQNKDAIFNQHPGPLPEFGGPGMYGRRVHMARLLFYDLVNGQDPFTEATTHRVTEEFDKGPLVGVTGIPLYENDRVETLAERVLPEEHALQIKLLQDFRSGNIRELSPQRRPSLVLPGEEWLLKKAKAHAMEVFPKG